MKMKAEENIENQERLRLMRKESSKALEE